MQELIGVAIVAATNRPEVIVGLSIILCLSILIFCQNSALMRPGRLDRMLFVGPPDQAGREEILRIKTKSMSVDSNLDLATLAKAVGFLVLNPMLCELINCLQCDGYSGAEITVMCQEAAFLEMQTNLNASFVSCRSLRIASTFQSTQA